MKTSNPLPNKRTPGEEREYRLKAAGKIAWLCAPVKTISVSRLLLLKPAELDEIGKAARELHELLDRAGLVRRGS